MAEQVGRATASGMVPGRQPGMPGSSTSTGIAAGASAGGADGQDIVPFVSQVPGTPVSFPTFHGRPVSWVAVSLIMVAFLIGGLALVFGPTWWLFWAALGLAVVGALVAMSTGIFDDWY
jgi:hypothetical protein